MSVASTLIDALRKALNKKSASAKELAAIKSDLDTLVKLAQNTGVALDRYFEVQQASIRAGVHASELAKLSRNAQTPKAILQESITRLKDERVERELAKLIPARIYSYRDDHDRAIQMVESTNEHLREALSRLRENDRSACQSELAYSSEELDGLVKFISRRLSEISAPLQQAYELLMTSRKPNPP